MKNLTKKAQMMILGGIVAVTLATSLATGVSTKGVNPWGCNPSQLAGVNPWG